MPLDVLRAARKKVVGTKQTSKALERNFVKSVYVARDADPKVVGNIIRFCEEKSISLEYVDSMLELGKACGIEIGAASAAVLE
jgi:large subunit ribosomal protein L7A